MRQTTVFLFVLSQEGKKGTPQRRPRRCQGSIRSETAREGKLGLARWRRGEAGVAVPLSTWGGGAPLPINNNDFVNAHKHLFLDTHIVHAFFIFFALLKSPQ